MCFLETSFFPHLFSSFIMAKFVAFCFIALPQHRDLFLPSHTCVSTLRQSCTSASLSQRAYLSEDAAVCGRDQRARRSILVLSALASPPNGEDGGDKNQDADGGDGFYGKAERLLEEAGGQLDSLAFGRKWKKMYPLDDIDKYTGKGVGRRDILTSQVLFTA
jgi:hypothetical protein